VAFFQSEVAVIQSGLSQGEMVVVSDPMPAIIGMKIIPMIDAPLEQEIKAESQAGGMAQ